MQPSLEEFREAAALRAALRKFMRSSERIAREEGLTPSRHLLLLMIKTAREARSTVTELAERMQLTQSTVTELVTRAEAAGLVRREQSSEDARISWLRLTADGEHRLARTVARSGGERQRLLELLRRGSA
ncbi:MAG TPA: MarR family transcriptional regulator [Gaiellaceae bacterium]|nr:MarR family transcriptional regulator [Gaiellaceae bacterium]